MSSDRETDEAAVQKMVDSLFHSMATNDLNSFLSIMSDDIIFMPPNMRLMQGKGPLKELIGSWFEKLTMTHEIIKTEIDIDTDLACAMVEYKDTFWLKTGGEKTLMDNKALYIFKRQSDGAWKMTHCIWNRNTPVDQTPIINV